MDAHSIALAIEQYRESVVSGLIPRMGNSYEVVMFIDIGAGMRLHRIAKYETFDGKTVTRGE